MVELVRIRNQLKIDKWVYIKLKNFFAFIKENNQQSEKKTTYEMEENNCKTYIWLRVKA